MEGSKQGDEKYVEINGKKYPASLWDEKYGEKYGIDHYATSLSLYHRKTIQMLLNLKIIQYYQPPDGVDFTCVLTPDFVARCEKRYTESGNKKFQWDDLFKEIGKENGVRLGGRLLRDMIEFILFVDKWGNKGQIWLR